jgi:hypothetical protein
VLALLGGDPPHPRILSAVSASSANIQPPVCVVSLGTAGQLCGGGLAESHPLPLNLPAICKLCSLLTPAYLLQPVSNHLCALVCFVLQANSEVSALLGRIPSAVGYQPTLATDLGGLQERITTTTKGSITSVQVRTGCADCQWVPLPPLALPSWLKIVHSSPPPPPVPH